MFQFYDVDPKYADYLRTFDKQIPVISYGSFNKFLCGIVFSINGVDYYAPVSHFNKQQKTNYVLVNKYGQALSSIRLSFMFPVIDAVLSKIDFSTIAKSDKKRADLMLEEYDICKKQEATIRSRAEAVYKIGCNKSHQYNYTCCDFQMLETIYDQYLV